MSDEEQQPTQADQLAAKLAKLKLKRRGQRAQMTKLFNRAEHLKSTFASAANKTEAHRLLTALDTQLTQKYESLAKIEEDILDNTDEASYDAASEESGDYMSEIFERNDQITAFIRNNKPNNANGSSANTANATQDTSKRTVALPKLQLKTFSGNVLEWVSFYDTFKSSVHNDSSLENIQKFTYLRSVLTDEAARTISGLALTNSNYDHALELLIERYGQNHLIIDAHMTALWQIPQPTS
ncbi:uncharacterized protein [Ptychodera flava]|uniref:uncharacterized protein n=1 Tax=Ptychodera flava TaxID=63121 RepID=UPI00396A2537